MEIHQGHSPEEHGCYSKAGVEQMLESALFPALNLVASSSLLRSNGHKMNSTGCGARLPEIFFFFLSGPIFISLSTIYTPPALTFSDSWLSSESYCPQQQLPCHILCLKKALKSLY